MFLHVVLFWDAYWTVFLKEEKKERFKSRFAKKKKQSFRNFHKKAIHRSRLCNQITFNEKKTVPLYNNDIN